MRLVVLAFTVCAALPVSLSAEVPPVLADLLKGVELRGKPASWCEVSMERGKPRAYAVLASSRPGGEYVVVERDHPPYRLAVFQGEGELSCHTPREARALSQTIAKSETLQGEVRPRWSGMVVCGFVTETEATCWQYSPAEQLYVKVGQWST